MKQLLSIVIVLSLLASCGVKRPLELPCEAKRHQSERGSTQQPDNEPCPTPKVDDKGNILQDSPPAVAPGAPASGTASSPQAMPGISGQP